MHSFNKVYVIYFKNIKFKPILRKRSSISTENGILPRLRRLGNCEKFVIFHHLVSKVRGKVGMHTTLLLS